MSSGKKKIRETLEWLFKHWELEDWQTVKKRYDDRRWDYIIKIKMGDPIPPFFVVCQEG